MPCRGDRFRQNGFSDKAFSDKAFSDKGFFRQGFFQTRVVLDKGSFQTKVVSNKNVFRQGSFQTRGRFKHGSFQKFKSILTFAGPQKLKKNARVSDKEIWNQNSGPEGQNFDSNLRRHILTFIADQKLTQKYKPTVSSLPHT